MKRISAWFGISLLSVTMIGVAGLILLWSFGQFDTVKRDFAGDCSPVAGIDGPEDIDIEPEARRAFISSFDRSAVPSQSQRGGIYAFSLDDPLAADAWRDRTNGQPGEFQPLGLYVYTNGAIKRLFVVNAASNTVELYDIAFNGDLKYLETFSERRLTSPNDIVAIGPRAFYVTNDVQPGRDTFFGRLQFLMRAATGKVFYFDGETWRIAAEGLRFANGINISPDGGRLYVAETAAYSLKIYDRSSWNGALTQITTVRMGAAVDNINVDRTGALWIGAHPKPLLVGQLASHPEMKAPSMVIKFDDVAGVLSDPEPVYADTGDEISGASAAARLGSTLLIGALVEKKFLICNLPG